MKSTATGKLAQLEGHHVVHYDMSALSKQQTAGYMQIKCSHSLCKGPGFPKSVYKGSFRNSMINWFSCWIGYNEKLE